jgi:hypothetical protein
MTWAFARVKCSDERLFAVLALTAGRWLREFKVQDVPTWHGYLHQGTAAMRICSQSWLLRPEGCCEHTICRYCQYDMGICSSEL